jgi:hypothetical protein
MRQPPTPRRPSGLSLPGLAVAAAMAAGAGGAPPAVAQDNYEIQVYGSDTVPAGSTMVELSLLRTSFLICLWDWPLSAPDLAWVKGGQMPISYPNITDC